MATQFDPIAKDESLNTTESPSRNIADVLAEELSAIEQAIAGGGSYTDGDGIDITNNEISVDTAFTEASTRANIASGDSFSTILGKIKKFFTDLKAVAFSGSYNDLSNKPTIPTDFVSKKNGGVFKGNVSVSRQNGTTSAVGYSDLNIGNSTAAGTDGNSTGVLRLYGNGAYYGQVLAQNVTANRNFELPNKDGTIALTSDIKMNFQSSIKSITVGQNGNTFNMFIYTESSTQAFYLLSASSNGLAYYTWNSNTSSWDLLWQK